MIRKETLIARRRQLCQDMGRMAWPGTTPAQHRRDVEECQAYLAAHPGATAYDVALELHYSDAAARRIMRAAYQNQIIMVLGTGGEDTAPNLDPSHLKGIHAADS